MDVLAESQALKEWLNEVREDFHRYPEPSWEEHRTQGKIIECLEHEGIECAPCACTGVVGLIRGAHPGPTIALRADIDAVKGVCDAKTVPYRSRREGVAHSCGHDAHAAMQMGAARILSRRRADLHGAVKLLFDPAEEGGGGARVMVAEGALEHPAVHAVVGPHMCNSAPGHIVVKCGACMAASASLVIRVRRPGGAGSVHVQCVNEHTNPLYAAGRVMAAVGSMQTEFRREPTASLVGLGVVKGGLARNTTDTVEIQGTLRSPSNALREDMKRLIRERIEAMARPGGCELEIEISDGYPALVNDPALYERFVRSASKILPADAIRVHTGRLLAYGCESFAFFSQVVPGVYYGLGGATGTVHGRDYDLRPDALPYGVALQVQAALDFLSRPEAS